MGLNSYKFDDNNCFSRNGYWGIVGEFTAK